MISRRRALAATAAALPLAVVGGAPAVAGVQESRRSRAHRMRTVFVAGDSTAAGKSVSAAPETGWGMALPFFLHEHLAVANRAVNGRSSKSFIDEGRLAPILEAIRPGDFLLVQFGHNDQKREDPARHTEPWTSYQEHLLQYVTGARARGACPVLLTSVERRRFDAAGTALATHGAYPRAVRALAAEHGVPLLDIAALSLALWQKLGPEPSKRYFHWLAPGESPNYPDGVSDNTHFHPPGAIEVARMTARALRSEQVLGAHEVRRLSADIPESWLTWHEES
ncbi:rhamnogalacturonan acetylesterase [Streptomyces agglomeratus]|uniref:rhamnogalacturonan acetylesterase n=1 Tax=Streptomyces agglomeratus TaxID=285458 RepID=UPI000854FFC2|nr:rhamnogalacturonan acetylesterase [Streptomyces agglomeratus]OEJ54662.1 rhamnogalacturonan acetylesterase [Streptomyces agglomeratus]